VIAAPPVTEIFFNLPSAKNANHSPPGEKNVDLAFELPVRNRSRELRETPYRLFVH
jgi:hypothetical protein